MPKSFKGPAAAAPGSDVKALAGSFFSSDNWGVQAVTLLGDGENLPVGPLLIVGGWILFVLRFVIFCARPPAVHQHTPAWKFSLTSDGPVFAQTASSARPPKAHGQISWPPAGLW